MNQKIGFLGAGKMGGAILAALLKAGKTAPETTFVCEASAERRREIKRTQKVRVTEDPGEVAQNCNVIFLAVKPQDFDALVASIAPQLTSKHLLISIAAGKTIATIRALVGKTPRIVRVMPNLALTVGAGMSAFFTERAADKKLAKDLLGCCGEVVEMEEEHFDAVTALSGSGPAFFTYCMKMFAEAGAEIGLPPEAAEKLARQTFFGTGKYLVETKQAADSFIRAVCSPKGTTEAGMKVLNKSNFGGVAKKTLAAAAKRSRELAGTPKKS